MAIVNKDLIQSYIMTTAKYDFNVYEKRIIYRLVEMAQRELQGIKFADNCQKIEHDLFSCVNITMPIACLLNGEDDKNYARVKEALQSLQRKIFEYEDDEIWQSISIIALPYIRKRSSVLSFQVHPRVWDCILDFSKGFRKYELKAAMSFKSQFSMRFYELLSNQKTPLIYSIEQLKEMFCVADEKNAIERAEDFQMYINQLNDFGCKSYWIASHTGIGATMNIEGYNKPIISFIANDYLGMSQREETINAGIEALKKYGTGACAAQVIGGYLDIHKQLEKEIADFVGQEDALLFSSGFGANAGVLRAQ